MNKKSIIYIIFLVLLVITVSYNKPIQVKDLIRPYTSEVLPKKINTFRWVSAESPWLSKYLDKVKKALSNITFGILSNMIDMAVKRFSE